MSEQMITCPNCRTEIKLTESLAAPLIEATRREYERKIAQKEADVVKREVAIREQQSLIANVIGAVGRDKAGVVEPLVGRWADNVRASRRDNAKQCRQPSSSSKLASLFLHRQPGASPMSRAS
jgi:hypothetical protein